MDELPLWEQIKECHRMLDLALKECKERGRRMVLNKAAYYSAKACAAFAMKEEGYPVTFIALVIKGDPDVAKAMTEYNMAEVEYENAKEARNVWKKKHDAIREEYQREWSSAGME